MLNPFVIAGLGIGGVALLAVMSQTKVGAIVSGGIPRGIRNNNPGNIRRTKDQWKGQSLVQSDPAFVVFEKAEFGVRALARVLMRYNDLGLRTVAGIIGRWAPTSENDTGSYVQHVARELGVDPSQTIDVREYLPRIAAAIIKHENGMQPYSAAELKKWVNS